MLGNRITVNGEPLHHEVEGTFKYYDQSERGEPFEYELSMEREMYAGHRFYVGVRKNSTRTEFPKKKVEAGLFLIGDNRNMDEDSREFGEVNPDNCIGTALFIVWPGPPNGDVLPSDRRFNIVD